MILLPVGILAGVLVVVLLYSRPLIATEMDALANRWRDQEICRYYSSSHHSQGVNVDFKRTMAAAGRLYRMQEPLTTFPFTAAQLLKHKKHEWVIVAFERDRSIVLAWMNKGSDRTQVEFLVSIEQIAEIATRNQCSTVLILHNHPNPDPSRYAMYQPSEIDLVGSAERGAHLLVLGVNLIEYVCERGTPHEYRRILCDTFMPAAWFRSQIELVNGTSRIMNLRLHRMRIAGGDLRRVRSLMERTRAQPPVSQRGANTAPADWYDDPLSRHQYRYWDGGTWTAYVANDGSVALDRLSVTEGSA